MTINGEKLVDILSNAEKVQKDITIVDKITEEDGSITYTAEQKYLQVIEFYNPVTLHRTLIIKQKISEEIVKTKIEQKDLK